MKIFLLCLSLAGSSPLVWAASSGTRSIYLNGVDISAAKNQAISQVDIKIDSKGNIYITAPQYEVQQETSFIPLGRQTVSQSSAIQHRKAGPLEQKVQTSPATASEELVSVPETGDTLNQPEVTDPSLGTQAPMTAKEGTRTAPHANSPSSGGAETKLPGTAPENP